MSGRLRANLATQGQSPGAMFGERLRLLNTSNHYTARAMKVEDVDALDHAKMEAFYKSQYANVADFTFFFVGAFEVDKLAPLIATYIGSPPPPGEATSTYSTRRVQVSLS